MPMPTPTRTPARAFVDVRPAIISVVKRRKLRRMRKTSNVGADFLVCPHARCSRTRADCQCDPPLDKTIDADIVRPPFEKGASRPFTRAEGPCGRKPSCGRETSDGWCTFWQLSSPRCPARYSARVVVVWCQLQE